MRSVPVAVVRDEGAREADPVSSPCWTPPCPHRLGVSPLSIARTRAVSLFQTLFQTLKEEHPAVEDKTMKSPWHLTASTRVLSSARRVGRNRVWRSTDGADSPKQEHDADPSDGLSAKASVVSRAIRPCLRQGCRRPCVTHAQLTAIWRSSGGRSADWRRSTGWCGARTAGRPLERAVQRRGSLGRVIRHSMRIPAVVALEGVRCATLCRGQQPQQGVLSVRSPVSKTASSGALLPHSTMICGKERSDDVPTEVVV